MTHVATQLRAALAAAVTGLPTTGSRVHTSRVTPVPMDQLPAIVVSHPEDGESWDEIPQSSEYPRLVIARGALSLRILAHAFDNVMLTLDAIEAETKTRLGASVTDITLGLARNAWFSGAETDLTDEGEQLIGRRVLRLYLEYIYREGAPEVAL